MDTDQLINIIMAGFVGGLLIYFPFIISPRVPRMPHTNKKDKEDREFLLFLSMIVSVVAIVILAVQERLIPTIVMFFFTMYLPGLTVWLAAYADNRDARAA